MSDLYERVVSQQDALKKLIAKLPGFKGYFIRTDRRSADKLLRESIADKFQGQWQRLSSIQRDLISAGQLAVLDDIEIGAIRLRQFIDRVKTAAYGYGGFFDAIKIKEDDLEKIYQYDLTLMEMADEIAAAIDNLEASIGSDGFPAAVRNVNQKAQDCLDAFNLRSELFKFGQES
jgi:hypothetical protein